VLNNRSPIQNFSGSLVATVPCLMEVRPDMTAPQLVDEVQQYASQVLPFSHLGKETIETGIGETTTYANCLNIVCVDSNFQKSWHLMTAASYHIRHNHPRTQCLC
jgi:hypothetical protein